MFGTHHLIPVSFLEQIPSVWRAFGETETVIGEIVIYGIEASDKMMRASMLPLGITMDSLLTVDDWMLVDTELRATMRIGLRELGLMHPAMINMLYTVELYRKTTEIAEDIQLDTYFQMLAMQMDKNIVGLETIEQQIELLFGGKDLQHEANLLAKTVRMRDEVVEKIKKLNRLYKTGKIEELVEMAKNQDHPLAMSVEEFAQINDNRNRAWMEVLPDLMRASPSFVAVGALHLGGENGLINLLRQQDFTVTAVTEEVPRRRGRR